MHQQIITIYCLCADFLQAAGYQDDKQARLSTAEVMTAALVAAWFFHGNQYLSCLFLKEHGYIPHMVSKSRFNRRLHAIEEAVWLEFFALLAQVHQQMNPDGTYIVDSLPVPVCDNIRIRRCHLYKGEEWRGYCASKRRYFYGLKVHLIVTASGQPVDVVFTPGCVADIGGFKSLLLELPKGSEVNGDAAYNDYLCEDTLADVAAIELIARRKKNSKRPHPGFVAYLAQRTRKRVETTFSQLTDKFARSIHAVTPRGLELKVFLTLLAYSIFA